MKVFNNFIVYFFYARSFGIAIKLLGLDKVFYFFLKRSFTGGAEKSKPFQVHQMKKRYLKSQYVIKRIRY